MADPNVYEVAHLKDADDILIILGVDYDRVTISEGRWKSGGGIKLTRAQAEQFAQYFVHAVWEAALDYESEPDREDGAPLDGYVSDPAGQSGPGVRRG